MSAFDNLIIHATSGVIVDEYSEKIVELLSEQINSNTVLTTEQKQSAINELIAKAPKTQLQFTKMIELIVKRSFENVKDQIHRRCYVVVPKAPNTTVNMSQVDILQNNGTYFHRIKSSSLSGYITGRVLFSENNL